MTGTPVVWANSVKYLGVSFNCKSGLISLSRFISTFYSQFNNISATIGKGYEIIKVHLVKPSCLPTLFYGCEA